MAYLEKTKRSNKTFYRIRYYHQGRKSQYLPLGTTLNEAEYILSLFQRNLARSKMGIEPFRNPIKDKTHFTLTEYFNWFVDEKQSAEKRGRPPAQRTWETYKRSFKFLLDIFGDIDISGIKIKEVEKALNVYAPATQSILIRSLRAAFNFGIKRKKIEINPFKEIDIPQDKKLPDILTIKEKDLIYSKITYPQIKIAFALARYAGLRRAEIKSLDWEDVLWDEDLIIIRNGKTGQNQSVPIVPRLKEILNEYKDEGQVITINVDSITHSIGKAMKEAGIRKHGAVHILRHSLGAELIQDFDIREVQEILRHSSITMTQRYTQISKKHLQKKLMNKKL
ncbi:tyrosine-type recombinase/integrase [bacterium]|nr:tyrosine-type recombinase/integrase [bacterium]